MGLLYVKARQSIVKPMLTSTLFALWQWGCSLRPFAGILRITTSSVRATCILVLPKLGLCCYTCTVRGICMTFAWCSSCASLHCLYRYGVPGTSAEHMELSIRSQVGCHDNIIVEFIWPIRQAKSSFRMYLGARPFPGKTQFNGSTELLDLSSNVGTVRFVATPRSYFQLLFSWTRIKLYILT